VQPTSGGQVVVVSAERPLRAMKTFPGSLTQNHPRGHCCVGRVCGLGQWSDDELSTVVRTSRLPVPA